MIEVEKKFILSLKQEEVLVHGAEFLGEKTFADTYYDDDRYSLTTNDLWLRKRGDRFELKVPMNIPIDRRVLDQYQELETDKEIAAYLKLPANIALADALRERSYVPFATIVTTRKKYKKDGYTIDIDFTDFGYRIAEIECMIDDASRAEDATKKIIAYAERYGLSAKWTYGKVGEYLKRNDPTHFQALIDAKVIK